MDDELLSKMIEELPPWSSSLAGASRLALCMRMMREAVTGGYARHQFNRVLAACARNSEALELVTGVETNETERTFRLHLRPGVQHLTFRLERKGEEIVLRWKNLEDFERVEEWPNV